MRSVPSLASDSSQRRRTSSGVALNVNRRPELAASAVLMPPMPILVARVTSSRCSASTCASSRSLAPKPSGAVAPYTFAVSQNVTPSSSARRSVAIDVAASASPYDWLIPMQPRPWADTERPCDPSVRVSMSPKVGNGVRSRSSAIRMTPCPTPRPSAVRRRRLALLVIPGPAVVFLVTRSVDQGRRAGLVSMLGVETGTFTYAVAAAVGLTGLIAATELGFTVVKYAGAAYLVYLGVRKLLEPVGVVASTAPARRSRLFLDGLLVQLLNPKIAVFFLAFLPQFVDPGQGHVVVQTLLLGTVFTLLAVLSDGACALLAGTLGGWLRSPARRRRLKRVSGAIYLGLGVAAAVTGRPAKA